MVNASVRQLRDQGELLYTLDAALNKYNVLPKNLEIEPSKTIWIDKQDDKIIQPADTAFRADVPPGLNKLSISLSSLLQ